MSLLFSDQTGLNYTNKTKSRYKNFFSILRNEVMYLKDFYEPQKQKVEWLADHGCVITNVDSTLSLNLEKVFILKDLYYNQVSCMKYLGRYENTINNMIDSNELYHEASLFTKPEQSYMNYVLNRAEFSNGLDLRNKYIHGTHSLDEEVHQLDYIELLKIMVLIIIKINEEFCLFNQ